MNFVDGASLLSEHEFIEVMSGSDASPFGIIGGLMNSENCVGRRWWEEAIVPVKKSIEERDCF